MAALMPAVPGMVRTMAASPRVHLANPKKNAEEIAALLDIADANGVQLCVFPELCLTGYTCGDLFLQPALLDAALSIASSQGRTMRHERTGGAGDIAIVGQAGIGVLDGLGLQGEGMHTVRERANIALIPQQIDLAARLMIKLLR